jgi:hypothetical protein
MKQQFILDGQSVELNITHMVNAGYAGSDQAGVQAHIEELAAIGVPVPHRVPVFYPVPVDQLCMQNEIQVTHDRTSAEIEYVYIFSGGKRYITVGSDHTDRALEAVNVHRSKQICPNIIASELWSYDRVEDHLDQLTLTCEVYENGAWRVYQNGPVTALLSPEALLELGSEAMGGTDGLVLYSGTISTIGEISYANRWRVTLADQKQVKQITAEYTVQQLPGAIE